MHAVAHVLGNAEGEPADLVRRCFDGLLGAMVRHRAKAGALAGAVDHFRKVAKSYRPGLFHCYEVADLPRTNNGLEQFFGSSRYHERRATGRKTASPGTVVRGSVRLIAGAATRLAPPTARDLTRVDPGTGEVRERIEMPPGVGVSGLESDGADQFFCGGGSSGKVRAVRRPKRGSAAGSEILVDTTGR